MSGLFTAISGHRKSSTPSGTRRCQRAEHRLRERQHDTQKICQGGAVDPRGVLQLARHREEELAQEKTPKANVIAASGTIILVWC